MLKTFTLKNGIKVATYNLPQLRSVHFRISVKGGSIFEIDENNGVAHFMEHMLVQGIPSLPNVEVFSSYIESLAGNYGATTDPLLINFNITLPSHHLEDAIKIGSEVFFKSLFVSEAIEKERRAVLSEIAQRRDSHFYKISEFFRNNRYIKNHPLTRESGGLEEVIQKVTRDDLIKYWQEHFFPDSTYILVTGRFDEVELEKFLNEYLAGVESKKTFQGYPKMSNQDLTGRQVLIRNDDKLQTNYLDLTFPAIGLNNDLKARLTQSLALIILGGLRNSRLFKLLRYNRGLVYDIGAGSGLLPGLGYAYANSEVSQEHLDEVVSLIIKEFAVYIQAGPTEDELVMVKNYLINQWQMSFDHPSAIASWIENGLIWNDKIRLPEEYGGLIKDITTAELLRLVQEEWDFSKLNLYIQGPVANSKENLDKFKGMVNELK